MDDRLKHRTRVGRSAEAPLRWTQNQRQNRRESGHVIAPKCADGSLHKKRPAARCGRLLRQLQIRTAMGLTTVVTPIVEMERPDWLVVPALNTKQPSRLVESLGRDDVSAARVQLQALHAAGIGVAGACIGMFQLAEAGILDGCEATTWSLAPLFRQRYPGVRLDDTRMVVPSGRVVTAGAAMGHLDLALWIMRQASPEMASLVARFLVVDKRPSQAQYIIPDFLAHADPLIERFERWARANLAEGFSLQSAAHALSVTPRTLRRRTESVLGRSPLAFFQDMRVEHARHLISIGSNLDDVADKVGYADAATLRSLLRKRLGRGVRELRTFAQ